MQMLSARYLGPAVLFVLLGLGIFIGRLRFDDFSQSATSALEAIKRPFSTGVVKLGGSLDRAVYTLFEQVYAEAEPPPLRLEGVAKVWAESQYQPEIYLQCDLPVGGMATLFNHLKGCVSLALGLGTNLVIPTTPSRNHATLNEWDQTAVPIGKWLDRDFFIERLQAACPRLKVALLDEQKRPILDVAKTVFLNPCIDEQLPLPKFCTAFGAYGADDDLKPWKHRTLERIDAILEARSQEEQGNMVLQMIGYGGFFNKSVDEPTARRFIELTELFRTPMQIRKIIATLTDAICEKPGRLKQYYGIHFRVEQDALDEIKYGWHTPEQQLERVLIAAEKARVMLGHENQEKLIYLACGEQDKIDMFRETAGAQGWTVIDKWTIAHDVGDEFVEQLDALDFDHMAMIDSAMLLVSDFFVGTGDSAFSWNIAHLRNPTGRYWGNILEPESYEDAHRHDVIAARSHLFNADERAEAAAKIIVAEMNGQRAQKYVYLTNTASEDLTDCANILSKILGKANKREVVEPEPYAEGLVRHGLSEDLAKVFVNMWEGSVRGDFSRTDPTLTENLQRKPASLEEELTKAFAPQQ